MTPILRSAILLLASVGLLGFHGCETLPERSPKIKNGIAYGKTRGPFRYRWWNYYERARSFADGGFWVDAELDLRAAIRQREADQRMARTYGMHFIDYFPHAELGVALYHQAIDENSRETLSEAVAELERSVTDVKSAKAEHYLDLAREALIRMGGAGDGSPPDIAILSPDTPALTNGFSVVITGRARDPQHFVRSIQVGETRVRIDVSGREIPFEVETPVREGLNRIPVRATNLQGKTAETHVAVRVDRIGPVIGEDGRISDPSGLVDLSVNGRAYPVSGKTADLTEALSRLSGHGSVTVQATDRAGNVTVADLSWPPARAGGPSAPLYAEKTGIAADWAPVPTASRSLAAAGGRDVHLELRNPDTRRVTYLDQAVIDGVVRSGEKSVTLTILGKGNAELLRLEPSRHTYHFSCLVPLDEGENWFNVRAVSPSRKSDELTLTIDRKIPSVRKTEARLKLLISPFELETTQDVDVPLSVGFEDRLTDALSAREPARFARVKDLESTGDAAKDEDRARAYAREHGFHYLLFGRIEERRNSEGAHTLIIHSRFEDLEGTLVVPNRDTEVYGEDLTKDNSPDILKALSTYMGVKLIDELPILEGQVLEKKDVWIGIDIGKVQRAKPGIDLIVYKLMEAPIPGFDNDTEQLGIAKITQALEKKSLARLYGGDKPDAVTPENYVITR